MGAAAADQIVERGLDLRLVRMRIVREQFGRGHDPAVDAIGALVDLFLDPAAVQTRDRSRPRAWNGTFPGSAAHHFVLRCARDTGATTRDHLRGRASPDLPSPPVRISIPGASALPRARGRALQQWSYIPRNR